MRSSLATRPILAPLDLAARDKLAAYCQQAPAAYVTYAVAASLYINQYAFKRLIRIGLLICINQQAGYYMPAYPYNS